MGVLIYINYNNLYLVYKYKKFKILLGLLNLKAIIQLFLYKLLPK